jgi:hypothetical protein
MMLEANNQQVADAIIDCIVAKARQATDSLELQFK